MHKVGFSLPRKDALEKVLGRSLYVNDKSSAGMLYGYTFRSPKPFIKIKRIGKNKAEKAEGVVKVLTHMDIPGNNFIPFVLKDYPALADHRAKFQGEAIALIAADSLENARKASKMIQLDYQELRPVFDPLVAMKKFSPRVFGNNNIFKKYQIKKGNIIKGFKEADIIVEKEFRTNYQVHCYLEPQGMIADYQPDGSMNIYGSMQCPFYVQDAVAQVIGLTKSNVKIIQTTTGGAFGGKEDVPSIVAVHAALLSYHTRKPVKLIYDREEDFISMSKRHPAIIRVKYGATKEGKITAADITCILDGGAYSTLSPIVLFRGTVHCAGPYEIPHVHIRSFAVATNKVPCGAFRGFGQPQTSFAQESAIDELAFKLNICPSKIREINGLRQGDQTATGYKVKEEGIEHVMDRVMVASNFNQKWNQFKKRKTTIKKGIGLSLTYYGVGLGAAGKHLSRAGAFVQVESDGSVRVAFGNTELGQGAQTVLAQIAAEELNAPYPLVSIMATNTSRVPDSGPTVASRTTFMSGNAIINAIKPIYNNILECAAELMNCRVKNVVRGNNFFYDNKGIRSTSYQQAVAHAFKKKLQLSSEGWYIPPESTFDKIGQGSAYYSYTFSANVAEVSVNMKTGKVRVDKIWSAHDVGKAINPQLVSGQIEGGVLQGIGYALFENLCLNNGEILNKNFQNYIIPTAKDSVDIIPIIVENSDENGPYGARGLGEPPLIGIAPALANAIFHATGIRMTQTPMLPEHLFQKIQKSHTLIL
ncbi:MAG: xanthine dehydrogenase family protein [Spirochaetes bacterium]|nr:xanthine dehydrogenase family protein [Spirochaetota bacterium]